MSAYAVVGEREQGTLEPVLTTPVGRAELAIGKAAAIFMPAAALGYLIFGVFVAITQLAAAPPVAAAVLHAPQLPAAGRAGGADAVPGDKPDVRLGRRPRWRPAGGPAVRPRTPHHRDQD